MGDGRPGKVEGVSEVVDHHLDHGGAQEFLRILPEDRSRPHRDRRVREEGCGNGVDHRSDIYSLGVIFYEMLTGEKPFRADTAMGIIYQHAQAPIPLFKPRFAKYQALLNMMLAKLPDDRLQSAAEIEEWL